MPLVILPQLVLPHKEHPPRCQVCSYQQAGVWPKIGPGEELLVTLQPKFS